MQYQRQLSAGKIDIYKQCQVRLSLQNVQRVLKPIRVINPFAEQLVLPKSVFKPRRTNNHYLQFIEAITFYYQCQRHKQYDKETGEEYIETTLEDIANANELLKGILLGKSDELTGNCRNYLEQVKVYLKERNKNKSVSGSDFTALEIRKQLRLPKTSQWRYHKQLSDSYLIRKVVKEKKQTNRFEIVCEKEYSELEAQIQNVLDDCLRKIKLSVATGHCSIIPKRSKTKVERLTK
jgi:hypothetical protein